MAQLKIAGVVRYSDLLSNVPGARVRIYDADSGGNGDDLILDQMTDAAGRFAGVSADWRDSNAVRIDTALGAIQAALPDTLLLQFQIDVDGRTHRGAFVHLGESSSAPIILPWRAAKVAKPERELVQIVTLSAAARDKALYDLIELGAKALVSGLAGPRYRELRLLENDRAGLDGLCQALDAASAQDGVKAVDLVFCTHGASDRVTFFPDQRCAMPDVAAAIARLPAAQRRKLRSVFSTACFGATHLDDWLSAGFRTASGSVGIYADSVFSLPAFLAAWGAGISFHHAVQAANAADFLRTQDALARKWFESQGRADDARSVNSHRETKGDAALTIESVL